MMASFPTKPTLSQGESPSLYKNIAESNVSKADTDGGYEFRRPRFTRRRRRMIETGFIQLPHADYLILDQFWEDHREDVAFTWYDYLHGVTRTVRFDKFEPDYVGVGQNRKWTIKIKMSEV
jgi:hypothetical protein